MATRDEVLRVYLELADSFEQQKDARMRDLFLMLAADAALRAGWGSEAERIRQRLLAVNPHHLLRPYASFAEAASFPDIQKYLEELRQKYPVNAAEEMLGSVTLAGPPAQDPEIPGTMPPSRGVEAIPGSEEPGARNIPMWGGGGRRAREEAEPPVIRMHQDLAETQPPPMGLAGGSDDRSSRKPPRTSAHPPLDQTLNPHQAAPRPSSSSPRPASTPIDQTLPPKAVPPPTRPVPRPTPAAPPPPARRSAPMPVIRPTPAAPRPAMAPEEEPAWNGAWVSGVLFVVVLLAGLALLVTTLAPQLVGIR